MNNPKVILLNGFAGSGKTTIARMYVDNHPLAMVIEGDQLIINIGDWLDHEDEARDLVFALTKDMLRVAIKLGHDVIVPYLVTNAEEVAELEQIATNGGAVFHEFYLATHKDHAIQRLLNRGTWGEAGLPPLTNDDTPRITQLYEHMEAALPNRPNQIHIQIKEGSPIDTYQELLRQIQ
ncbi:MAG TPA: AAA family ATPase [Patescibacteria group bacterium]|nr:AAA family ATPase [Patescibacteria group bacterium]